MITYYVKKERDAKLSTVASFRPGAWVDLKAPTKEEIKSLSEGLSIPLDFITSSLDEYEKPRCDVENGVTLIILNVPYKDEEGVSSVDTIPLGIIITSKMIMTVRLAETGIFDGFVKNKVKDFFTSKKTRFLLQIILRINQQYITHLDVFDEQIDEIEKGLMTAISNKEIVQLFSLQKTLVYFNKSLINNGNILERIERGKLLHVRLFADDLDFLEDIIVENKQAIEMASVNNDRITRTHSAFSSIVSNNLNDVMKVLTSLTIILAIPTIVASLYGMNVGLPLQRSVFAFWYVLLLSLIIIFVFAIIFLKKKWL